MGLSPYFGNLIADRLHAVWLAKSKPEDFQIYEFGGGTGVLARDVLSRLTSEYPQMAKGLR